MHGANCYYGRRGSGVIQYFVENFFYTECGHKDVERAYTKLKTLIFVNYSISRCKSDDGALQQAGEISSGQNFLLQYPHPCPQDCYTQSYVVAIPKVLGSNFWYSDPVDRGVCIL